jgi:hypothetical protein
MTTQSRLYNGLYFRFNSGTLKWLISEKVRGDGFTWDFNAKLFSLDECYLIISKDPDWKLYLANKPKSNDDSKQEVPAMEQ